MPGSELPSKSYFLTQAGAVFLQGSRQNANQETTEQIPVRTHRDPKYLSTLGSGEENIESKVSQTFTVVDIHTSILGAFDIAIEFSAFS